MLSLFAFTVGALAAALHSDPDGQSLARRIRAGDRDAFRTFFDRHHERLIGYVTGRGIPPEVAEDIVQNAFLYIWDNRDKIEPDQSLRAYLFRIGYTRALNHRRDEASVDRDVEPSNPRDVRFSSSGSNPSSDVISAEVREQIDEAIASLPERRRTVFELCFLQDLTYQEAAEALDITRKTVENHMGLALRDLRDRLGDDG